MVLVGLAIPAVAILLWKCKIVVTIQLPGTCALQAQVEAGVTFKKSTKKGAEDMDFVPVNLHIQQMKVNSDLTENKGKVDEEDTFGIRNRVQ